MLLLIIFSSFFVLLLPGAASPPPPAPSSSRDSSSPPALLPSFFTPSSPLLSPSFTVILLGRRERKEGGTKSGQGAPQRGREIPGLRGEKFSCRNSSQHGRRCLLLNPLSFAVPTQQPVPRAGGGKPRRNPPQSGPKGRRDPPAALRHPPEGLRGAFGGEIAQPNSGVWKRSAELRGKATAEPAERGSAAGPARLLAPHPTPSAVPRAQGGSSSSSPCSRGDPTCRGGGIHVPRCGGGGGFSSSLCACVSGAGTGRGYRDFQLPLRPHPRRSPGTSPPLPAGPPHARPPPLPGASRCGPAAVTAGPADRPAPGAGLATRAGRCRLALSAASSLLFFVQLT